MKSKLAREVNRLTDRRGPVFDRRYEMTVVTDEDAAQIERLRYVLAQSVKEGLVERLAQWPGVHCVKALLEGKSLTGRWFEFEKELGSFSWLLLFWRQNRRSLFDGCYAIAGYQCLAR